MGKPYDHAVISAEKFGGKPEDYLPIHNLMDSSKKAFNDLRHRALTHHPWFVYEILPLAFGEVITNSAGGKVSVKDIGEQHIMDDFNGEMPAAADYLISMEIEPWMDNGKEKPPSRIPPSQRKKDPVNQPETVDAEKTRRRLPIESPGGMLLDGAGNRNRSW